MRRLLVAALAVPIVFAAGGASAGLDVPPPMPDLSTYARKGDVPAAAGTTPPATALDGAQGASAAYARADHTHAARVQRTTMTTAADGTITWTFARPIVCAAGKVPPISYMVEDGGTPVVVQITGRAFTSDAVSGNDTHTAITVKAQRSRTVPALVATIAGATGFDVFGTVANGVKVNLFAADPTQ